MHADRERPVPVPIDIDALIGPEHVARTVWAFVEQLDLEPLRAAVKSAEDRSGRPAIDPAILVALWLYATIDAVGSARKLDRLCDTDAVYRWLCGGVSVSYHILADFRTGHGDWLDAALTRSIASLLDSQLVTLKSIAQDGMRVRALAKAASFRRRPKLERLLSEARARATMVECVHAHERRRGLGQFLVRSLAKTCCVALWRALTHDMIGFARLGAPTIA